MLELYIIIARKIFFRILGDMCPPSPRLPRLYVIPPIYLLFCNKRHWTQLPTKPHYQLPERTNILNNSSSACKRRISYRRDVRPFACPLNAGIVLKDPSCDLWSRGFHWQISPGLYYLRDKDQWEWHTETWRMLETVQDSTTVAVYHQYERAYALSIGTEISDLQWHTLFTRFWNFSEGRLGGKRKAPPKSYYKRRHTNVNLWLGIYEKEGISVRVI